MRFPNVRPAISRVHVLAVLLACSAFQVNAGVWALDGSGSAEKILADATWREYVSGLTVNGQPASIERSGPFNITTTGGKPSISVPSKISIGGKPVSILSTLEAGVYGTGKLAVSLAKVAGPVGVAVTAYELFSALDGYLVNYKGPNLPLEITKINESIVCPAKSSPFKSGCAAYIDLGHGGYDTREMITSAWPTNKPIITFYDDADPPYFYATDHTGYPMGAYNYVGVAGVVGGTSVPATEDELIAAIASKSGWPSGLVESTIKAGLESGIKLDIDPASKTVSGPANTEPKVTTKLNPDGTTEKTTEKSNITYQGNNITVTNSSVVSSYNPVTNNTTTTESTTENPDQPTPDQCEKTPDTIGCAKFGDIPEADKLKTKSHAMDITAAAFTSSAACPAPVQLAFLGHSYEIPYDPLCDKLALLKPLMMLFASAFAAYVLADSFKV